MLIQSLSGHCLRSRPVPGLHAQRRPLTARFTSRCLVSLPVRGPRLAGLLGLVLLVGLAGCGPAPSDQAANSASRSAVGGPSESSPVSQQSPSPRTDSFTPVTPAASPVPRASVQGTGAASGMGTLPGGDSRQVVSAPSPNPVDSPNLVDSDSLDIRVVPDWMANELASPYVGDRLRALDTWQQSAPQGAVGPLIVAFEKDKDERVRARAMELLLQHAVREAEAEELGGE